MRLAFTDVTIRQLPHTETGQKRYFDINLPGFGLTVGRSTKTFLVIRGEKRQLTTLGRYPDISLQDARKQAKRLLAQELPKNGSMGLPDAVAAFLEDCRARLRPNTVRSYETVLKNAPNVTLAGTNRKTVPVTTAHETKAYKALMNWCVAEELVDRNPFAHLSVSFGTRERVLTDEELKTVWHYEDGRYTTIIKLLILTGQRLGEITAYKPEWVAGDTLTIPADIAKNGISSTIPFNLLTAKYLQQHEYFNGFSRSKERMDKLTGVTGYTHHDLRRSYSTRMAMLGVPIHVTERLLNHRSGTISGVAATYNRYNYLKEMREAVLLYEQHIATLVGARA